MRGYPEHGVAQGITHSNRRLADGVRKRHVALHQLEKSPTPQLSSQRKIRWVVEVRAREKGGSRPMDRVGV